jgi:hypothetical protein
VCYQISQPAASQRWQELAKRGDTRLIFDIDDAMWAPDWAPFQRYYTPEVVDRMMRNAYVAHVVTTSSYVIAEHMAKINPNVHFVPYTMPAYLLDIVPTKHPTGARRMGFGGSASHDEDFGDYEKSYMLKFLADNRGWDWHFIGKAKHEIAGWPKHRAHAHAWTDHRQTYYRNVATMDAMMAPLRPTLFNRCKSALRFLEDSALGVATIAEYLDPYFGYLSHNVNGFYVGGPDGFPDWPTALAEVARSTVDRVRCAATARQDAAAWTTEAQIQRWTDAFNSV